MHTSYPWPPCSALSPALTLALFFYPLPSQLWTSLPLSLSHALIHPLSHPVLHLTARISLSLNQQFPPPPSPLLTHRRHNDLWRAARHTKPVSDMEGEEVRERGRGPIGSPLCHSGHGDDDPDCEESEEAS